MQDFMNPYDFGESSLYSNDSVLHAELKCSPIDIFNIVVHWTDLRHYVSDSESN